MELANSTSVDVDTDTNGHSPSTNGTLFDGSLELRRVAGSLMIIIMILGLVGNTLTVAAVINYPKIRKYPVAFIVSLTVSDILYCILVMPFSLYRFINDRGYFVERNALCVLYPVVHYTTMGVSLFSIAMISINRFVKVALPARYATLYTLKTVTCMILFVWFFPFSFMVPNLAGVWGEFDLYPPLGTCSLVGKQLNPKKTLFALAALVPCTIVVICYIGIFCAVRRSKSRLEQFESTRVNGGHHGVNGWRLTKTVLIIFIAFVLCYFPPGVLVVANQDKSFKYPDARVMSYVLNSLSVSVNPIIYFTMNKHYRMAYKSLFRCTK